MASLSYIESSGLAWATKKTISLKKSTVNNENEEEEEKRGMKKGEEEKGLGNLGQGSVQEGGGVFRKEGI